VRISDSEPAASWSEAIAMYVVPPAHSAWVGRPTEYNNTHPGLRRKRTARIHLRKSIRQGVSKPFHRLRHNLTLQVATNASARGTSTPDQSLSMLLMAKAQYKVRKSFSLLPGTVEKLAEIFIREDIIKLL
jgi:hypothetical protein